MNRVGLKDYLLNHADDNDLLDCAKAWDAANEYGYFETYGSVEEAAEANGWDVAQALNESRHVDQDADFFRLNGYGHLESVSNASLLDDAHGFCERFADSIAGLGESLDDMCEDRCEVASATQTIEANGRDEGDKKHDDSEIGE